MGMIYAIITKDKRGIYGNTDFKKAGEYIFGFERTSGPRFM
jgi:hypothetical protein